MRRRGFIAGATALCAAPALGLRGQAGDAGSDLLDAARALAARPHEAHRAPLPAPFADLDYDAYRGIRPRRGQAAHLAIGPDYEVDLLPPGLYFPEPVGIEIPEGDGAGFREVAFSPELFSFEPRYFDDVPDTAPGAGFSGLRLRHPLGDARVMDEVLVVQGASYFRAVGRAMVYGLSARAVALGTGGPEPEEFPRFTRLRVHRPDADGAVRIEGVIDSPALAGHLEMTLRPGATTRMRIAVTLIPRRDIADVGVAPLTSMYLKGPMRAAVSDDFRPRVHDSDLLFIRNGAGESLWRPIVNPARTEISSFLDDGPVSFGLFQTMRRYAAFEDTEARYHDRPSAIVSPAGDWGRGAVVLVEIPTDTEFMDNIVAFWRPERPLATGREYRFDYDLIWTRSAPAMAPGRAILQSRSGREHDRPGTRRFVIDLAGSPEGLSPEISARGGAEISGLAIVPLPGGRGTRVTFLMTPEDAQAVDLRMTLKGPDGSAQSPVWTHRWTRARDGGV